MNEIRQELCVCSICKYETGSGIALFWHIIKRHKFRTYLLDTTENGNSFCIHLNDGSTVSSDCIQKKTIQTLEPQSQRSSRISYQLPPSLGRIPLNDSDVPEHCNVERTIERHSLLSAALTSSNPNISESWYQEVNSTSSFEYSIPTAVQTKSITAPQTSWVTLKKRGPKWTRKTQDPKRQPLSARKCPKRYDVILRCEVCNKIYRSYASIVAHEIERHPEINSFCCPLQQCKNESTRMNEFQLDVHLDRKHPQDKQALYDGFLKWHCKSCRNTGLSYSTFKNHIELDYKFCRKRRYKDWFLENVGK